MQLACFIMKIALDRDNAPPRRKNHTPISPNAAGAAPHGAVADGKARNPPPMVVPAIRAACDNTVVVVVVLLFVIAPSYLYSFSSTLRCSLENWST